VHRLLYVVLIASRKLRHYFQAHKISVVTSYPLKVVLHSPHATVNIAKWVAKLAEFELDFLLCHVVKSQVLANFVVDWTPPRGAGRQRAGGQSSDLHRASLDSLLRRLLVQAGCRSGSAAPDS
jgi:hypothetical protein